MNSPQLAFKIGRLKSDLTQLELATLCGTSEAMCSRFETGRSIPTDEVQIAIAKALRTSREELFPAVPA